MNIILHIVSKDLTGLRWQAAMVLALQLIYAALHFRPLSAGPDMAQSVFSWLLIATHLFFISSAVHADAIPGDRQYWLTRPFTRRQLLAAKLVLTLLVVHVPLFLSDCIIISGHGFNPLLSLGGLLWRQALYFFSATMLILALAAVTRNLTQFALSAIVMIACAVFLPSLNPMFTMSWGGLTWIRILFNILLATTGAVAVLWLMYIRRRLKAGWAVLATTVLLLPFAMDLAPFAFAFRLQSQVHADKLLRPSIQFDATRVRPSADRRLNQKNLTLLVPIRIDQMPSNTPVLSDHISAQLRLPNGETRNLKLRGIWSADKGSGEDWIFFPIDSDSLAKYGDTPVSIDITLYMTAFGRARTYQMPAKSPQHQALGELGRCESSPDLAGLIAVSCFAPVQLPSRITAQLVHPTGRRASRDVRLRDSLNYSPFPTDHFQFYPMAVGSTHFSIMSVPGEDLIGKTQKDWLESNVYFQVRDPRSHFTTRFTVPPMPLRNLVR